MAASPTESVVTPVLSRRELAKEERRERILAAAERLVRRRGDADLPMRELADEAGVAFKTLFNLFDSKERLLATLFHRRIWPCQLALATSQPDVDPVGHVFAFTSAAFSTYSDDRELFRPLLRTLLAPAVRPAGDTFEAGADLWAECLAPARREGILRPDRSDRRLDRAFHLVFRGTLGRWASGDVDTPQAAADLRFAIGTLLAGAVVGDQRHRLEAWW